MAAPRACQHAHHRLPPVQRVLAASAPRATYILTSYSDICRKRALSTSDVNQTEEPPRPSGEQLRRHWLNAAIPMVGFGMMDNFIMIQAGDLIDSTLGVKFGLATMTAAALGQVCSDFSGVCFGGIVEAIANKLGLPAAGLSKEQLQTRTVKNVGVCGAALGVVVGCGLGMSCLLFMDLEKAERLKKQAELSTLFDTIMQHGHRIMNVEHCTLWLVEGGPDEASKCVSTRARAGVGTSEDALRRAYMKWDTDHNGKLQAAEVIHGLEKIGRKMSVSEANALIASQSPKVHNELDYDEFAALMTGRWLAKDVVLPLVSPTGLKARVYRDRKLVNIHNMEESAQRRDFDAYTGHRTVSVLMSPIFDEEGDVTGMVEMVNKKSADGTVVAFNEYDEKMIEMLSVHAGIFIDATTK